ncbi:MAG: acyl-CoA thioesterase [Acetobacteraceae bacterium]|nr:acyl-CoA thioesterase [Acetobacteraceae bacterium]
MSEGEALNETVIHVRYGEADEMGVVHHSVYYQWFEVARFEFARRVIGLGIEQLRAKDVYLPVRESHCRYLLPVRFPGRVVVAVTVELDWRAMFRAHHRAWLTDAGQARRLVAEAETLHVFVDGAGRLLHRIPPFIRDALLLAVKRHPILFTGVEAFLSTYGPGGHYGPQADAACSME